ncbi:MAG: DNA ligase D [Caulobacteraceae bacterium]|nr:DNA ligase D [Caulobacteraceae bacterium]
MADRLKQYREMRDFSKTAEPRGERPASKSGRLRFVVQKHAATRLHYDLRLEYEGVFLSWAVTRGPSLDPEEKRLAVETEPHPLEYGDFEGTIPKGEYGGGAVMLWDRGYWDPDPNKSIAEGLEHGHIAIHFDGKRLKGGYHLVKIKNDRSRGGRANWLLFKSADAFARPRDADRFLKDTDYSVASGRTLADIAAGVGRAPSPFMTRTPQAAAQDWSASSGRQVQRPKVNPPPKVGKKPEIAFVDFQLCRLAEEPPKGPEWAHEIKLDGYRIQAVVRGGEVTLFSRKGLDWTDRFPEIADDCADLPDGAYDGEICALDGEGRPDFPGLQAALSDRKTSRLVYFLFDAPFGDGEDLRQQVLAARKERLQDLLEAAHVGDRLRYAEHFRTSGAAMLESACQIGLEGIVSKRLDAPYRSGRSDTWIKIKCRADQEVVLGGWTTTGAAFRSLLAGVYRDGKLVHVGRIGTGFGEEKLKRLLPQLRKAAADRSPFEGPGAPKKAANIHWLKPVLVAEIAFAGFTGDGNIRQASFKGLRDDKDARQVVAETEGMQQATIIVTPTRTDSGKSAVVEGVSISNPDKPLWPSHGDQPPVSKREHAEYLDAVMDWLLPHIAGRPCSIIRTPDGIDGDQRFFQRHAGAGTSDLITEVKVRGDKEPYLQFDTPAAVIAAAQSGATEFHPWNCLSSHPEIPGRFVFDLDPDEAIPFDRVIAAAKEVKERLEALGLSAFLKTTGGKGLHVVTPLKNAGKTPVGWPEAKAFTKALVSRMADDSPGLYTVNMAKKVRGGRIFLDYLRNDRMSTAVALLSARARPGATVSYPLSWAQAKKGLDPSAYTVRSAPRLMKRNRAWDGYDEAAGSLKDAIRRLGS